MRGWGRSSVLQAAASLAAAVAVGYGIGQIGRNRSAGEQAATQALTVGTTREGEKVEQERKQKQQQEEEEKDWVRHVLQFWFEGDGAAEGEDGTREEDVWRRLYRTRWFPGTVSPARQREVDEDVGARFGDVLQRLVAGDEEVGGGGVQELLAAIVVLDQLSRHVYRGAEPSSDGVAVQAQCDAQALRLASQLCAREGVVSRLSVPELVFALMPLRHSATIERLQRVLEFVDARDGAMQQHADLLAKFRKTTLRKLQELQDKQESRQAESILERPSVQTDESDVHKHALVHAVRDFLRPRLNGVGIGGGHGEHKDGHHDAGGRPVVAISLSGGVDSMVLSKILAFLSSDRGGLGFRVVAVHIDYANREESGAEAEYVEQWCQQLDIEFRKRVVSEVSRGVTARDEYERVAREARYGFYQEVLADCGAGGMIFGHHRGDVEENVISNTMKGADLLRLSGMDEESRTSGVLVWRPLLAFPKSAIFEFAHRYGVPYFRDTTPTWSTRGKLRNELLPLLQDIYGSGCMHNLTQLAHDSDQLRDMVFAACLRPFWQSVEWQPGGFRVDVRPWREQPVFFWKTALRELVHGMGMHMIGEKALTSLMRHLRGGHNEVEPDPGAGGKHPQRPRRNTWLPLKRDYWVYLEAGHLIVLRAGLLDASSQQMCLGQSVRIGNREPTLIGNWHVKATVVEEHFTALDASRASHVGAVAASAGGHGGGATAMTTPAKQTGRSSGGSLSPAALISRRNHAQMPKTCARPMLSAVSDLIRGKLTYYLWLPRATSNVAEAETLQVTDLSSMDEAPPCLATCEKRVRGALPLVMPARAVMQLEDAESAEDNRGALPGYLVVRVEYTSTLPALAPPNDAVML